MDYNIGPTLDCLTDSSTSDHCNHWILDAATDLAKNSLGVGGVPLRHLNKTLRPAGVASHTQCKLWGMGLNWLSMTSEFQLVL